MGEYNNTLREQMMRCYIWGYLTQRHNDYKIAANNAEYSSYRDLRLKRTEVALKRAGIPNGLAKIIAKNITPIEKYISYVICTLMFIIFSVMWFFVKRRHYKDMKFCPKLTIYEKMFINIYKSAGYGVKDVTHIYLPGQSYKYKELPSVSVFSGISYGQLFQAYVYSIKMCAFLIKKYRKEEVSFRAYSSFPYFVCFFFVENLDNSNELVMYNHYDRWMYMLGNSHLKRTYIQHGKLWYDQIKRIKCDVAYYINHEQQKVLEHTLFDNKPEAHFRKSFEYTGMEKLLQNGNKDVLIVCFELEAERHETALKRLADRKVNIYLKPHPGDDLSKYDALAKDYQNVVVLGLFDYPKVDYVISYNSSLADEYEMHDIPVVKYSDEDYEEKIEKWFNK